MTGIDVLVYLRGMYPMHRDLHEALYRRELELGRVLTRGEIKAIALRHGIWVSADA